MTEYILIKDSPTPDTGKLYYTQSGEWVWERSKAKKFITRDLAAIHPAYKDDPDVYRLAVLPSSPTN